MEVLLSEPVAAELPPRPFGDFRGVGNAERVGETADLLTPPHPRDQLIIRPGADRQLRSLGEERGGLL